MRGLLLDLDRTLIDIQSYTDYAAALEDLIAELGDVPDVATPPTGWDSATIRCMAILTALAGDPAWERASELIERHELTALAQARPMPGMRRFLDGLDPALPVAVVTLLGPTATSQVLAMHRVPISTVVPRRPELRPKPAPDQLIEGCRLLGVEPTESVMVGDSTWDLEAAKAAGAGFVGLTNGVRSEFPPATSTFDDLAEIGRHLSRERTI